MRALLLASVVTFSGCVTTLGAAAGAGIGSLAGSPVQGAVCGGLLGLRVDIELVREMRKVGRALAFWM